MCKGAIAHQHGHSKEGFLYGVHALLAGRSGPRLTVADDRDLAGAIAGGAR